MYVKSWKVMTLSILHIGTILGISLMNAQLPHSSDVKIVGIQPMQMAVLLIRAHIPNSLMCRIDLLSLATTVLPTI